MSSPIADLRLAVRGLRRNPLFATVLLAIGLAIGLPAAFALGRYISTQLYGIKPDDPLIATTTMILLALVSAAAGLIPAHRASRIDPILALRYE